MKNPKWRPGTKNSVIMAGMMLVGRLFMLAACSPTTAAESSSFDGVVEPTVDDPTIITEDRVLFRCGACHFDEIENASIASFNRETVNAAIIESMCPEASDEEVQALADYFASIDPPTQDE